MNAIPTIVPFSAMEVGHEVDTFARLAEKERLQTRDGKPYYRVAFGDSQREVRNHIWLDSPYFVDFTDNWFVGDCFKLRATLLNTKFGLQLDIKKIRPVTDDDKLDGFDRRACMRKSDFEPEQMFDEIQHIAQRNCGKSGLTQLIAKVFTTYRTPLLEAAAARVYHHNFIAGLLEHTLSVTRIVVRILDHYDEMYSARKERISRPVAVAGGILHDIGKVTEMTVGDVPGHHTTEGELMGHIILGRDIVRDIGRTIKSLDDKTLLHLEHIILSHQRTAEWGSPKPPMTMEAMIVHHADSLDAMIGVFDNINLREIGKGEISSKRTLLGYPIYRVNVLPSEREGV
ncbi:MAG: 3'-5' exoribonuclease YhaM family protein [Thermoguttaceae bacterium]